MSTGIASFTIDASQFLSNFNKFDDQTMKKIEEGLKQVATAGENEAKRSAPWTDRTTNARNSIRGQYDDYTVYLSIGMFYGVFLELSNGGKYRIVWPTIEWMASTLERYLKI
jgi:hypothetical protein